MIWAVIPLIIVTIIGGIELVAYAKASRSPVEMRDGDTLPFDRPD